MEPTYKFSPVERPLAPRQPHLSLLFSWDSTARAVALREGDQLIVGRSEPAGFILEERSLSRAHARFVLQDGTLTIQDLDSTNGVWVNGIRVREAVLGEEDTARLGSVEVCVNRPPWLRASLPYVSHAAFLLDLEQELQRARLFGRSASVVAVRTDRVELERAASQLALRQVDRVCQFAPSVWLVLLAESGAREVAAWFAELEARQASSAAVGSATYPTLACAGSELVSLALEAMHGASRGRLVQREPEPRSALDAPIVLSPAMKSLYERVERAARASLPVLILGETGSGKELVAHALHTSGPRARGPFKAINCASIPLSLLETALFGHERGAFTGADRQVQGIFEQADQGTVFLDEVGELSAQAQAALLRVLESQRIVRVGGTREHAVDVRVVAATHRDLGAMVASGAFREDLLYRLDALTLHVPPLRERTEEILPLATMFLQRAKPAWATSADGLSAEAAEALLAYDWPGNVRQLKNMMECAATLCAGSVIQVQDLPLQVRAETRQEAALRDDGRGLLERVRAFEAALIQEALAKARGNQSEAARMLGVPRRTLSHKAQVYGLTTE